MRLVKDDEGLHRCCHDFARQSHDPARHSRDPAPHPHGEPGKSTGSPRPGIFLAFILVVAPAELPRAQAPAMEEVWIIGNCNLDDRFDVADAITMLDFLFVKTPEVPCVPLCDVTEDSDFDIADAIAALSHLFEGKPLGAMTPPREEKCDAIDNDCDGIREEGCTGEGLALVDLSWDPVTLDAEGNPEQPSTYRVYTGSRPGEYTDVRNARATTQFRIHGLTAGVRYYFVVTAIDRAGNESAYSNEVTAIAGPDS